MDLDLNKVEEQVAAAAANWKLVEKALAGALRAADTSLLVAELDLPEAIRDVFVDRDGCRRPRRYSKALVSVILEVPHIETWPLSIKIRIGVEGKKGVFFPTPTDHQASDLVWQMSQWRNFAVWMGGAQAFLDGFLSAAVRASATAAAPEPMAAPEPKAAGKRRCIRA